MCYAGCRPVLPTRFTTLLAVNYGVCSSFSSVPCFDHRVVTAHWQGLLTLKPPLGGGVGSEGGLAAAHCGVYGVPAARFNNACSDSSR